MYKISACTKSVSKTEIPVENVSLVYQLYNGLRIVLSGTNLREQLNTEAQESVDYYFPSHISSFAEVRLVQIFQPPLDILELISNSFFVNGAVIERLREEIFKQQEIKRSPSRALPRHSRAWEEYLNFCVRWGAQVCNYQRSGRFVNIKFKILYLSLSNVLVIG